MLFRNCSIEKLKGMLEDRKLDRESLKRKDEMIATLWAHEIGLINTVSFEGKGRSMLRTYCHTMRQSIHDRLTGRGIPAVGEIFKSLYVQDGQDILFTAIMYLDAHGITYDQGLTTLAHKIITENPSILTDLQSLMKVRSSSMRNSLPFQYEHLSRVVHSTAPKTFSEFSRLPAEIREMIWKITAVPRIVTVVPHMADTKLTTSIPILLAVNTESREIGLKLYYHGKQTAPDGKEFFVNYFDFNLDTIFFNHQSTLHQGATEYFLDSFIDKELQKSVKNIAIDHSLHGTVAITPSKFPKAENAIYVMSLSSDPIIFEPHEYLLRPITPGLLSETVQNFWDYESRWEIRQTFGNGRKWLKQAQIDIITESVRTQGNIQFGNSVKVVAMMADPFLKDRLF